MGDRDLTFSVVRYGNVMVHEVCCSPLLKGQTENFAHCALDDSSTFLAKKWVGVLALVCPRGEMFVQDSSYRVIDVAEAIGPTCTKPIVGIRPGEKIHEEMITASDSFTTII